MVKIAFMSITQRKGKWLNYKWSYIDYFLNLNYSIVKTACL